MNKKILSLISSVLALTNATCGLPIDYTIPLDASTGDTSTGSDSDQTGSDGGSGSGNGSGSGSGSSSSGVSQKSLLFDGVDEQLTVSDHADFNFGAQMSLLVWVKASSASLTAGERVVSHFLSASNERAWAVSVGTDTNKFSVFVSVNGGNGAGSKKVYDSSVTVFDDAWHLIGFTFNAGTLKVYVDGVEDTGPTKSFDAAVASIHDSTGDIQIADDDGGGNHFTGYIDDIGVYSIELTAAQVSTVYNSGAPIDLSTGPASASLISWWQMGDHSSDDIGTTNQIIDAKSGRNATVSNMESTDITDTVP